MDWRFSGRCYALSRLPPECLEIEWLRRPLALPASHNCLSLANRQEHELTMQRYYITDAGRAAAGYVAPALSQGV